MVTLALRHCLLGHVVDFRGFEMADGEVASSGFKLDGERGSYGEINL